MKIIIKILKFKLIIAKKYKKNNWKQRQTNIFKIINQKIKAGFIDRV